MLIENSLGLWLLVVICVVATFLFGYVLGSIPFGFIFTKLAGLGDIRRTGSGNIGATNVLRAGRKDIAALTLTLDALKGTVAVLLINFYLGDLRYTCLAGFGAFIGHLFPVWLRFRGGKGVATYLGILLGLSPAAFLIFAGLWLCTAFATRFSSVAALTASVLTPIAVFFMHAPALAVFLGLLSVLLISRHRENIRRLLNGTESRIGNSI